MSDRVLRADIVRTLPGFSLTASFDVGRETLVLFGPSGSGKSLTLQALAGIDRPDGGRITLGADDDEVVLFDAQQGVQRKPQERRIGYVPQTLALFPHLSVLENVVYGLRRQPRPAREEHGKRLLALMRITEFADRLPRQLSGGQQQRVALARALAVEPRLLLLDEPFTALDGPTRRELGAQVRRIHDERGIPVLLVTHDRDEAFALADRIAVIDQGRILQISSREDAFARPLSRRVAELVGIENVLPAIVRGVTPNALTVEWGATALTVRGDHTALDPAPGQRLDLAIAASQLLVLKDDLPLGETSGSAGEGRANVIEVRAAQTEMARDTVRMELLPIRPPSTTALQLELPAYVYYRLGLDSRANFAVQLKPEWLHPMASS